MRLVVQRVNKAKVKVEGKMVGKIGKGLFVLLGVREGDTKQQAEKLAEKLSKLRIMADDEDKMNLSVEDVKGEVLVVSQFTLNADTSKGNRPSFVKATNPEAADEIYKHFIEKLKSLGIDVATGEFGAYMDIDTILTGPVTIILEG